MKKVLSFLIILVLLLALYGCESTNKTKITYQVNFVANAGGYISGANNQIVQKGGTSEVVKAIPDEGYEFTSWSDGVKDAKRVIDNIEENINVVANFKKIVYEYPSIYIITENFTKVTSKEEYVKCVVTVDDNKNPEYDMFRVTARIRGRGNSTWDKPKKPYKLKFDQKVDLFGNGASKTWTLIANYVDPSLMRNYLAYTIGAQMDDLHFTTTTQFANVYMNGDYQGLYLICEQIETGKNRVEINDKLDGDVSFLVELDQRILDEGKTEGLDYFYVNGQPYGIKAPDTEDEGFTRDYCTKIKNYLDNALNTVHNKTFSEVEAILDVNSFADGYIIHELFSSIDVNFSSWYMYKDKNGKLTNGPIWDFDISAGNCDYNDQARFNDRLFANVNTWYKYLLRHQEFVQIVRDKLVKYHDMILFTIDYEVTEAMKYRSFFEDNFQKWKILGKYEWPNPPEIVNIKTWEGQVNYAKNWLFKKLNYMKKYYLQNN